MPYEGVAIVAPYTQPYERYSERSAAWFLGRTLAGLLQQTGLRQKDIDGLSVTSMSMGPDSTPAMVQQLGLSPRWLNAAPFGGASGPMVLQRAARAVQMGDADIVACLAGDTLSKGSFADAVGRFSRFSMDAAFPYGAGGPNAVFALITQAYMQTYGTTRKQFGQLCVAQRAHGANNPNALLREPITLEAYLQAREIVSPLHLLDCVMPCAGGEGFIVMSETQAQQRQLPFVTLRGYIERHNAFADDPVQLRGGWAQDREALYEQAQTTAQHLDFVQTYDDYPVISFLQLEGLGLCEPGEAAEFFSAGERIPHNTGGGQLANGQAGYAGGFVGTVEALRQLTGNPLGRAVDNAHVGLVSGYGFVNYDRGLCTSAVILDRGNT